MLSSQFVSRAKKDRIQCHVTYSYFNALEGNLGTGALKLLKDKSLKIKKTQISNKRISYYQVSLLKPREREMLMTDKIESLT